MIIEEKSISELQALITSGDLTSVALTQAYLKRIEDFDASGPKLNSVIELNPDALSLATASDAERAQGKIRGPLHGIPFMVKDNMNTGDKMMTTAGSLALEGHYAKEDAFIVKRLRDAGAVLIGKTNLSEWANFRSSRSSSGWSSRGGQTRNPYAADRTPCGSSSGSGVAVSANFCAFALGTETDGSVVCPSSVSGLVGVKPTLGLLSRSGIIPLAHSQDTAGPMTRSLADAAVVLSVLHSQDERDAATSEQPKPVDYQAFLNKEALKGARLGVVRNLMGYHEHVDALAEQNYALLRDLGAELIDVDIPAVKDIRVSEFTVLIHELKHGLDTYLANTAADLPKSLADVITFNETHKDKVMPYFAQESLLKAQETTGLNAEVYIKALADSKRLAGQEGIDKVLLDNQLDALIAPTGGPAWAIDQINGDRYLGSSSGLAAVSGHPHITVPGGLIHGLPVGFSFFAQAYSEPKLFSFAYAFEQASQHRKAPSFLLTADL